MHCGIHSLWIPCSCDNWWWSVIRVVEGEKDVSWFISLIGQYPNPQPALNNSPKHCNILCSRSALECCQEAAAILEQLADTAANTDDDKNHLSLVQDRLAAAYLWQALLEHKATMEDKPEAKSAEELSESYDTEEVVVHIFFFSSEGMQIWPQLFKRWIMLSTG